MVTDIWSCLACVSGSLYVWMSHIYINQPSWTPQSLYHERHAHPPGVQHQRSVEHLHRPTHLQLHMYSHCMHLYTINDILSLEAHCYVVTTGEEIDLDESRINQSVWWVLYAGDEGLRGWNILQSVAIDWLTDSATCHIDIYIYTYILIRTYLPDAPLLGV